jgi:hypothetical protein
MTPAGSEPATDLWDPVQSPDGSRLYARTSGGFVLMMPTGYG